MTYSKYFRIVCALTVLAFTAPAANSEDQPKPKDVKVIDSLYSGQVFEESDGLLVVEAEHFARQEKAETRRWYIVTRDTEPGITPDGDPSHADTASGGAYIELLPDTRRAHSDELITGVNFSNDPGLMAVLTYPVYINNPGRYYVWVRACFTTSEDNGIHVGIDGTWPESGRRMQWCEGGGAWRWDSKQRTNEQHCGVPYAIYLDIDKPGPHTIQFSLREDGFEFDRFLLTKDREFQRPENAGPPETVRDNSAAANQPLRSE